MITKQLNGFVGYGSSDEEALDSCRIISVLQNAYNIRGFEGLEKRRTELAPWKPKKDSMHIHNVGYITFKNKSFIVNKDEVIKGDYLFEVLYKIFFGMLSMLDISLCAVELNHFFKANGIVFPKFSSYSQVVPEDVYLNDKDICSTVMSDIYSIVFYNSGKVAMKKNAEELYWVCSYDKAIHSLKDIMYYIAYVRGYENIDSVLAGGGF